LTFVNKHTRRRKAVLKVCRLRFNCVPKCFHVFLQSIQPWSEAGNAAVFCYELKLSSARQFSSAGRTNRVMLTDGTPVRYGKVVRAECN
jgi:hypothetical protein